MRRQYLADFQLLSKFETSVTDIESNPPRFNFSDTENSLPSHFETESLFKNMITLNYVDFSPIFRLSAILDQPSWISVTQL